MKKLIYLLLFLLLQINLYAQWVQCNNNMGSNTVYALLLKGSAILAGTNNFPVGSGGVYISTNYGNNWSQTTLNNCNVYCLKDFNDTIFAGTNLSGVLISTDNGFHWTQTSLMNKIVYSLAAATNNIYAGTLNGVYYSSNHGLNWINTGLSIQINYSMATLNNYIYSGTFGFGIFYSTNYGTNWLQTLLTTQDVRSLIVNGNNIFAGTAHFYSSSGGIYLSTNNGTNWSQIGLIDKSIFTLVNYGNYLFAGTSENGVYLSTNTGNNWMEKNQGFMEIPFVRSLMITNNYIFVGTDSQSVWRRPLSDIISINNNITEVPGYFLLFQNYPNPFNPETKIKFDIPPVSPLVRGAGGMTVLKVYDILGKEILTLVNEKLQPGTYEVTFNASQYPSGVYFYRLKVGEYNETKRMILLK